MAESDPVKRWQDETPEGAAAPEEAVLKMGVELVLAPLAERPQQADIREAQPSPQPEFGTPVLEPPAELAPVPRAARCQPADIRAAQRLPPVEFETLVLETRAELAPAPLAERRQ